MVSFLLFTLSYIKVASGFDVQLVSVVVSHDVHTVLIHSIRQSRVTGPQKSTKCHDGHGHFGEVTKSFLDSKKKI